MDPVLQVCETLRITFCRFLLDGQVNQKNGEDLRYFRIYTILAGKLKILSTLGSRSRTHRNCFLMIFISKSFFSSFFTLKNMNCLQNY